jgi:hypothetical protein
MYLISFRKLNVLIADGGSEPDCGLQLRNELLDCRLQLKKKLLRFHLRASAETPLDPHTERRRRSSAHGRRQGNRRISDLQSLSCFPLL